MARHKKNHRIPGGWPWVAGAVAVALAVGVSVVSSTRPDDGQGTTVVDAGRAAPSSESASGGSATSGGPVPCDRPLRVVTSASFAPVLTALTPGLAAAQPCAELQVTVADGRSASGVVEASKADVWIPDDAAWATVAQAAALAPDTARTVATSPLLFAMPAGSVVEDATWAGMADSFATKRSTMVVRDPLASGDGLVAAAAMSLAVAKDGGPLNAAVDVVRAKDAGRTVPGTALPQAPGEVAIVPEYALVQDPTAAADTIVAPADATALLRYTWLPTRAALADPARASTVQVLGRTLGGARGRDAIAAAGLRAGEWPGVAPAARRGAATVPPVRAEPMKPFVQHYVWHVLSTWDPAQRAANLLVVTDVSGSMADAAPGGDAPVIDLVRDGLDQTIGLLPDNAEFGLWEFGYQLQPPDDFRPLVQPAPLTADQRATLGSATAALTPRRTGTSLYATILAAYRYQQDRFDPTLPTQVIVFTDGVEEDSPDTLTADQLRDALAAADPAKRVQLAVFGFGDRVPVDELMAALKPVQGQVDPLTRPQEVAGAFVHAVSGGLTH